MNKWLKILLFVVAIAVALMLFPTCLKALVGWLERPYQIDFSGREKAFLYDEFGIDLPGEGRFVEAHVYPSRDPTTLYIFEFTSPAKLDEESAEAFVRSRLGLDDRFGSAGPVNDHTLFGDFLTNEGWEFTHHFSRENIGSYWASVFYRFEDNFVEVAVVYTSP